MDIEINRDHPALNRDLFGIHQWVVSEAHGPHA